MDKDKLVLALVAILSFVESVLLYTDVYTWVLSLVNLGVGVFVVFYLYRRYRAFVKNKRDSEVTTTATFK